MCIIRFLVVHKVNHMRKRFIKYAETGDQGFRKTRLHPGGGATHCLEYISQNLLEINTVSYLHCKHGFVNIE